MFIKELDTDWRMKKAGAEDWLDTKVPGSMYSTLFNAGLIPDPYYGENQYDVYHLSRDDYEYTLTFTASDEVFNHPVRRIRFDGLDTLCEVSLNGKRLGNTDNMHRTWIYDVTDILQKGENTLCVYITSPLPYLEEKQKERFLWNPDISTMGFSHIRKAHYQFGWDWGPRLPDLGIWRPVWLEGMQEAQIDNVYITQKHSSGSVLLGFRVETLNASGYSCEVTLTSPDGGLITAEKSISGDVDNLELNINNPLLWWPNGYGAQPLYNVAVRLTNSTEKISEKEYRIGLRELLVSRDNDEWGQEFCFKVNGVKIFAMGADYIPEDQIISWVTPEHTRDLLEKCAAANFNCIRVWGGGYYQNDNFYNDCDELGLIVWQDFMFACGVYRLDDAFRDNITLELRDNILRLRSHACIGLWCGNNEMETAWRNWGLPDDQELREDYHKQFEELFPKICEKLDPERFYMPSSPTSFGLVDNPDSPDYGDQHFWAVWHGLRPLTETRKHFFRFCSEYGFESMPSIKTIREFAKPEDMQLFSPVMEAHQKGSLGMEKLLYYISQAVAYPYSFEHLIYATQLLQADAIRSTVEHMRRNRGRCMGSTYWQLNDSNPVISWSSIDYKNRWKALQYYAKRFHSQVLLSVNEQDSAAIVLNVSSERMVPLKATLRWTLRDSKAVILRDGSANVDLPALCARDILTLDMTGDIGDKDKQRSRYLEYSLIDENGEVLSCGANLFVQPKHFRFTNPTVKYAITDRGEYYEIELTAAAYAKSVYIDLTDDDCVFSDNWFDIHGSKPVVVEVRKSSLTSPLDLASFAKQIKVISNYDLGK